MLLFVLRRFLSAIPTLFVIVTVSFFMIRLAPGGPFNLDRPLDPTVMANLNRVYHLDEPLLSQYFLYLGNLLRGDFGPSFVYRDYSVGDLFANGLPVSIQLGLSALLLALASGITLGVIAALKQNSPLDYAVVALASIGVTIPTFVVAPLLSLIFGVWLGVLPAGGWGDGAIGNKILPIITLALPQIAVIARLIRGTTIEVLRSDHIRTVRAYGLPLRSIIFVHTLRASILPVVSYLGPAAAALVTGSIVVETIFGIPGIGRFFVQSALNRDYTLVMGTVVVIAIFVLIFNMLVDFLYAFLDPRVRLE